MTGTVILSMLLGAALVAIGILAAALSDRIRGIRLVRERAIPTPREQTIRANRTAAAPIEVVEAELVPAKPRAPRADSKIEPKTNTEVNDVIAALVAAGYKKVTATEAAWGCSQAERATIELWTRAALRRCAQGASS
jgi:hypothetical protein